jgi:hypothetical protein
VDLIKGDAPGLRYLLQLIQIVISGCKIVGTGPAIQTSYADELFNIFFHWNPLLRRAFFATMLDFMEFREAVPPTGMVNQF